MNPLDLPGPEFLRFYAPYGLCLIVFAWMVRAVAALRSSPPEGARWAPGSYPREGDAYAIALLRAGTPEAVRTLLSRLTTMGLIRVENQKLWAAAFRKGERQLQPIELTGWQALSSGAALRVPQAQALVERAVRPHLEEIGRSLAEQGLAPGPERRSLLRAIQFLTWLAVVGLGLAKLGLALERGRTNVGFLILLLAVFWIAIRFVLRTPLRTSAGSRYLKWLQESHHGLVQKLQKGAGRDRSDELALAAGIYGLSGLTAIPALAALDSALHPRYSSSSSGGSGSSGDSGSGSDSGSSSDGGSSCGGGGCGGCGGGGGD